MNRERHQAARRKRFAVLSFLLMLIYASACSMLIADPWLAEVTSVKILCGVLLLPGIYAALLISMGKRKGG